MIVLASIRPARPEDARIAAALLYSTGPHAESLAFGSPDRAIAVIRRLFESGRNSMSYEYTSVVECGGRVAGILALLDKKIEHDSQAYTGVELLKILGPLFMFFKLPVYVRLQRMTEVKSDRELCIAGIAVSPDMRHKGIGRFLMSEAERVAKLKGYKIISLYVLRDNTSAIGFYKRLGYRIEATRVSPWLATRYGFVGFLRMIKDIEKGGKCQSRYSAGTFLKHNRSNWDS